MSKWSRYKSQAGGSGGLFLKVESGTAENPRPVEFLVPPAMVPYERYVRWDEDAKTYVDEDGPGEGISVKILLQVVRPSGEPGILEIPAGTFADLCAALDHPKVGGVEQIYEISKTGTGKGTRWKVVRLDRASPEQIAWAARAHLPEITKGRPMQASEPSSATKDIADEPLDPSIPF